LGYAYLDAKMSKRVSVETTIVKSANSIIRYFTDLFLNLFLCFSLERLSNAFRLFIAIRMPNIATAPKAKTIHIIVISPEDL